jgi:hypothetical protein
VWCHRPVILALGRLSRRTVNFRLACTTQQDPVFEKGGVGVRILEVIEKTY